MAIFNKKSFIQNDRLGFLKKADLKIPQNGNIGNKGKSSILNRRTDFLAGNSQDKSIFGEKLEISRKELEDKLRTEDIHNLSRKAGLNLSSAEMDKIEKDFLPGAYGSVISKEEFKLGVDKLKKKGTTPEDLQGKAKLKKELDFFKKIGGIK